MLAGHSLLLFWTFRDRTVLDLRNFTLRINIKLCEILGFHRGVNEIFVLPGCYAMQIGS